MNKKVHKPRIEKIVRKIHEVVDEDENDITFRQLSYDMDLTPLEFNKIAKYLNEEYSYDIMLYDTCYICDKICKNSLYYDGLNNICGSKCLDKHMKD